MNVLKAHKRITIKTLQERGASQREIERRTGVDRKTIRRYERAGKSPGVATGSESPVGQIPPPRPPADEGSLAVPTPRLQSASRTTPSECEPHRLWIEGQVQLGRNAVSIYQDHLRAHTVPNQSLMARVDRRGDTRRNVTCSQWSQRQMGYTRRSYTLSVR